MKVRVSCYWRGASCLVAESWRNATDKDKKICPTADNTFGTPKVQEFVIPPGATGPRGIFADDIPQLERRSRQLRSRLGIQQFKKILVVIAILGVLVAVAIAVQQQIIAPSSSPALVEESVGRVAIVLPTATPIATATRLLDTVVAQISTPMATATFTAGPSNTPAAKVIASKVDETPTPTATLVATSTATAIPTPAPVSTPTLVPTSTPTATPVPARLLVLDVEATVEGYWSDGTAEIDLKLSLRNEGSLAFESIQPISVACTLDDSAIDGCSANAELSLPDGFNPVATDLTLRAPMGTMKLEIDYGANAPLVVHMDVPERILGVDRSIWECFSDRAESSNEEGFRGCYGWYKTTVEKWRSDSTVRVWATGNENYIRAFRETLDEQLAPELNLNFEWVDDEQDADFVAILGVSKSDAQPDRWPNCLDAWGCGGPVDVRNGEVRKADLIIYHLDSHDRFLNDYPNLKRVLNGVFIHEALHGLAPTGHAERSKVILSSMHSANYLTYIDKAILSLNSHPLVEPGMAMSEVEPLIIFRDELLDDPQGKLALDRAFRRQMRYQRDRAFHRLDLLANQPNGYGDQDTGEGRNDLGPNIDRVRPITLLPLRHHASFCGPRSQGTDTIIGGPGEENRFPRCDHSRRRDSIGALSRRGQGPALATATLVTCTG